MALHRRDSLTPAGECNDGRSRSPQFHSTAQQARSTALMDPPDYSSAIQHPLQPILTFDSSSSVHQPKTHLSRATSVTPKPKQKIVTMAKARKHGGRKAPPKRSTKSATPAPEAIGEQPKLTLKMNFGLGPADPVRFDEAAGQAPQSSLALLEDDEEPEEDEELPEAPPEMMSRSGRVIHKPQHPDVVYGSDYLYGSSFDTQKVDEDDYQDDMPSSPPPTSDANGTQVFQLQKRKRGRPSKNTAFQPSLGRVEEEVYSSDTIAPASPSPLHHRGNGFEIDIDDGVYDIMNGLRRHSRIYIDLPVLSNANDRYREEPYTAKFLMHLYLLCYENRLWNLCDLIADTWIRAFHVLRKKGQKDPQYRLWRPNTTLEKRQRLAKDAKKQKFRGNITPEFDSKAPNYELDVADPELDDDVLELDSALLNLLYKHTDAKCGARFLWADAMALGGDKIEDFLDKTTKDGFEWHKDLLFNIMSSSMRLVRRKLTLKIEESTEGAYCKRYHEHTKHGLPCYRELAWRRELEGGDSSDEEDDHAMEGVVQSGLETGQKRGIDGGEMATAKRVRFGEDVDAEGDSE